ncbi:ABC transporter ATP-binding protein [Alphaproteobacteria bacterium KMM 3653]|uniref:ABC transporter ATP-binding protein n=1 Tax=Harenicola maris TaxID=2841044 RepID=A0AAP2CL86_9RHOB|nr:ABC transporter ATP-binding protein [Harenicola maris]
MTPTDNETGRDTGPDTGPETTIQGEYDVDTIHVAPAIELRGISKAFGPVQANKDISIHVAKGTIHGIIGENGAGKSTLMSILYGFYKADAGEILISGKPVTIPDSQAAIAAGIGMVFQHFKLVENFSVLENVVLGAESGALLAPSLSKARRELTSLAKEYELNIDPDALIQDIGVGMQQRVEILKALYRRADILILDEPTGVLTPSEADQLFRILRRLKEEGKTIILITHKLREIMETTDTVSVMRRGEMTATVKTAETSPEELAELMVGRKVLLRVDKTPAKPGPTVLEVRDLNVTDAQGVQRVKGISFDIHAGEVLGIAGVAGNGQSELLEVLGGYETATGTVTVNGEQIDLTGAKSDARSRRERGIAHVPEDRQREGLIMDFHAWENAAFGYHHDEAYRSGLLMNNKAIWQDTEGKMERFDVRPPDPRLAAKNFSGGNQQKIVLAREIERNPELLLIGQPTRGVDIGAIEFIHQQIIALRDQGKAILLVSVELEEILALSDRIAVMFDGQIMGERMASETDERELGLLMAGVTDEKGAA